MQSDPVNLFSCDVFTEQSTVTLFYFHNSDKTQRQVQRHVSQETHVEGRGRVEMPTLWARDRLLPSRRPFQSVLLTTLFSGMRMQLHECEYERSERGSQVCSNHPSQLEKFIFNSESEDFRGLPNTELFPHFLSHRKHGWRGMENENYLF